jgi:hypothetical protein
MQIFIRFGSKTPCANVRLEAEQRSQRGWEVESRNNNKLESKETNRQI